MRKHCEQSFPTPLLHAIRCSLKLEKNWTTEHLSEVRWQPHLSETSVNTQYFILSLFVIFSVCNVFLTSYFHDNWRHGHMSKCAKQCNTIKTLVSWIMKLLVLILHGQWMWKSREINSVLHLVIMYLSQKGEREHNSILTLKPWLPSKFSFNFFPVAILSGTWAAGIALGKSSVPAHALQWQPKGVCVSSLGGQSGNSCRVWRAPCFPTHVAGPTARRAELHWGCVLWILGNTGYQTDWHSSAIKKQQCITPPIFYGNIS